MEAVVATKAVVVLLVLAAAFSAAPALADNCTECVRTDPYSFSECDHEHPEDVAAAELADEELAEVEEIDEAAPAGSWRRVGKRHRARAADTASASTISP